MPDNHLKVKVVVGNELGVIKNAELLQKSLIDT